MELDVGTLRSAMEEKGISQVDLARRSGVSRTRLNAILQQTKTLVHPSTAAKISKALGLPENALDNKGVERSYLEAVVQQHKTLDFSGLGIVTADALMPIDRVFASAKVRERPCNDQCLNRAGSEQMSLTIKRRPQKLANALTRYNRFITLGDPGSGKTTALRHLANVYAAGRQTEFSYPSEQLVPIFVRLADWGEQLRIDAEVDIINAALNQLGVSNAMETSNWLRKQVESGKVLLLLDGLDEVSDPDLRGTIVEKLRTFIESHIDIRVVVSSRIVGFETPNLGAQFDTLMVEPLSTRAINDFEYAWNSFRHGHKSTHECRECDRRMSTLRHAIMDNPRIRALASNPMMLTILLLLQEAGATLPQRRWDLYEKLSEAFLFSWQEKKRAAISGSPDGSLKLEDRELVWILESLGLEMQHQDRTLVPRWWLTGHLGTFLERELSFNGEQARSLTDALTWSLQERSGLIAERGPDRYGFRHLAFQEYFAARAILAADDPIRTLRPFIYHPRWREVVQLVAGQLDRRRVPQLLRIILDDPDPAGRMIGRGLLTALGCLADGAPLNDAQLLEELCQQTIDLGRTKWLGVSLDALELLNDLRSTRLEEFAKKAAHRMLEVAKESLDAVGRSFLFLRAAEIDTRNDDNDVKENEEEHQKKNETFKPVVEMTPAEQENGLIVCISPVGFDANWAKQVVKQLILDDSPRVRAGCAWELARFVNRKPAIKSNLLEALSQEQDPQVRVAIAGTLGRATSHTEVKRELLERLNSDSDEEVRGACASALGTEAARDEQISHRLESLLLSDIAPAIRAGAALGLARRAPDHQSTRDILMSILNDPTQNDRVRVACVHALRSIMPDVSNGLQSLSQLLCEASGNKLASVTAQILAQYAASGRAKWSDLPIERIEHALMSVNEPCPHSFDALRGLVDARERRRQGIPREARIKAALSDVLSRIQAMFIFGSSARGEQSAESDIDLMIIGDLSLQEVTPGLKRAEQELGRQVNAVLYSVKEWDQRYRNRNPFVTQVMKSEKIFILGDSNELAAMAG